MLRSAFPRRRAHMISLKTASDMHRELCRQLVDAVIIDGGAGDEAYQALSDAQSYQSIPFFVVTAMLSVDAPMIARGVERGVCEYLVEGVDDSVARAIVVRRSFTTRFEQALAVAPEVLGLVTTLQQAVWAAVVRRAGRPVRTEQLARELSVSREHLSRSFATGRAPTLKRIIDLVRLLSAAELSKNAGYDVKDVASILAFSSSSHLSSTTQRLVGARASSLTRLRAVDLIDRFVREGG